MEPNIPTGLDWLILEVISLISALLATGIVLFIRGLV
jgi:hypothetical protein